MGRGRAPCCEKVGLNKGSWTPEEDIRLVAYIRKYGHGNWRALPKQAGLLRCGKSCRLRWINYLRPDIKRGHFSKEEEDTVIKLHRLLGNKWSKIASCLPGRTDNEIKNVWNTHLKKRLKEDDPSSPSSGTTTSISLSVEAKSSIADGEVLSLDKIEIPSEPCFDLWDALDPSALSFQPPPVAAEAEVDDYDLLDIPIDPDLWSDVAGDSAADAGKGRFDDSQRWVAYLEEELGLFGGGGEEMMVTEGCDPVRSYFQKRPSSPSLIELVDHCCLDGLS